MLAFFTIVIMLIVAYAFYLQGVLTAFCMLVNVFLAGLAAFNLWEPIAAEMEAVFAGSFLHGFEDWICLIGLFSLVLGLLRLATNSIASTELEIQPLFQQGGAVVCGLLTGYLVAGFLACVLQTLPWQENFMTFDARVAETGGGARRFLPGDRVWLALMRRASVGPLAPGGERGFDPEGSFTQRYLRHRRYSETRDPLPYGGDDLPIQHSEQIE